MKKIKGTMDKTMYLDLLTLEFSKTLMYEFWYDSIQPKNGENAKLCHMDTDSFINNFKIEDFYKDIAADAKKDLTHQTMNAIDHCLQKKKY